MTPSFSNPICLVILYLLACNFPSAFSSQPNGEKIPFIQHEGHFERNDSRLTGQKSFLAFDQFDKFEATFGVAALGLGPTKKKNFVTQETFNNRLVLAAIYRGKSVPNITDIEVSLENGTISVKYQLESSPEVGFNVSVPMTLSIPKTECRTIEFYENDRLVATLKPKPKPWNASNFATGVAQVSSLNS